MLKILTWVWYNFFFPTLSKAALFDCGETGLTSLLPFPNGLKYDSKVIIWSFSILFKFTDDGGKPESSFVFAGLKLQRAW
ncbi:MAG: hypothetical protein MST05_01890 [Treponema sp.]|nr:hypothetical protein [Treponema sp.]